MWWIEYFQRKGRLRSERPFYLFVEATVAPVDQAYWRSAGVGGRKFCRSVIARTVRVGMGCGDATVERA